MDELTAYRNFGLHFGAQQARRDPRVNSVAGKVASRLESAVLGWDSSLPYQQPLGALDGGLTGGCFGNSRVLVGHAPTEILIILLVIE